MRTACFFLIGAVALSLSATVPSRAETSARALNGGRIDFEAVLANAKAQVYPALVFVKPIREDFGSGERTQHEVFGSGVIISPDGYVVTNNHVAEKAIQINCVLFDKRQVPAETIGLDPETDLALLKLQFPDGEPDLPYAEFADSDTLEEGQFVMALGSPFGFTRSISLGIISNTQRYIGFDTLHKYNNWIQTDAAINPGNSGGPLVNTEGRIVGINTLGLGSGTSLGFSIPSNIVQEVIAGLREDGKIIRAWTGIKLQALKDFATNTFTHADTGVLIQDVEENSPADQSGMRAGDILVSVNGKAVDGAYVEYLPAILRRLAALPLQEPARFVVQRNGERLEFDVEPRNKGSIEGEDFEAPRWDMTFKEISKFQNPELHFLRKEGVYVQGVKSPGNAAMAGLRWNDILLKIGETDINTLEDVQTIYEEILADEEREKKVLMEILRGGYKNWIVLDYRKDWEEEE